MSTAIESWHPAATIFPMFPEAELIALADDIEKNGQREPILILDGKILDGRNRNLACKLKGIEPITQVVTGIDDPVFYVLSLNLHRRHLTPSQASMCAARAREVYELQAKERQQASGGDQSKKKIAVVENLPQPEAIKARDAAGKAFGVSGRSVDFAKKVIEKGIPELVKAVDEGRMAVSTAAVLASETEEVQREGIERHANRGGSKPKKPPEKEVNRTPRPTGEYNLTEAFALSTADVAITQLRAIKVKNKFRNAAIDRVQEWINAQKKEQKS
jgi:hypothetical protein